MSLRTEVRPSAAYIQQTDTFFFSFLSCSSSSYLSSITNETVKGLKDFMLCLQLAHKQDAWWGGRVLYPEPYTGFGYTVCELTFAVRI
jgi:hypothetical protein